MTFNPNSCLAIWIKTSWDPVLPHLKLENHKVSSACLRRINKPTPLVTIGPADLFLGGQTSI